MCRRSSSLPNPRKPLLQSWKILRKMNPNQKIHFRIMNPFLHSNSTGLQTILVIRSLTHREGVVLRSLYFAPILFAIPGDRTPNLTTITVTTNYYTPYPIRRPWSRLSHSLMAVCLMPTSCQILQHAYHTASHLGASCISSPLYDPYLASCSSHVSLMTRTRPIGYDPLI